MPTSSAWNDPSWRSKSIPVASQRSYTWMSHEGTILQLHLARARSSIPWILFDFQRSQLFRVTHHDFCSKLARKVRFTKCADPISRLARLWSRLFAEKLPSIHGWSGSRFQGRSRHPSIDLKSFQSGVKKVPAALLRLSLFAKTNKWWVHSTISIWFVQPFWCICWSRFWKAFAVADLVRLLEFLERWFYFQQALVSIFSTMWVLNFCGNSPAIILLQPAFFWCHVPFQQLGCTQLLRKSNRGGEVDFRLSAYSCGEKNKMESNWWFEGDWIKKPHLKRMP